MIVTDRLMSDLLNIIHNGFISNEDVYKLVFIGYLTKKYDIPMDCKFDNYLTFIEYLKEEISSRSYSQDELSLLNKSLTSLVNSFNLNNINLKMIVDFINNNSKESYLEFIRLDLQNLIDKYNRDIPKYLSELVLKILNTKKGGKIVDLICGNGNFLTNATTHNSNISVLGLTKDTTSLHNTELRLYMLNADYQVDYDSETGIKDIFNSYDSVFGLLLTDSKDKSIYYNNFINTKNNSTLWKYIDNGISMLNAKGKAVFITINAPLFKNTDLEYRKYLIENKLVEAIIELPSNIFYHTGISTTMIVLSHNSNNMVNMIDATNMFTIDTKTQKKVNIDMVYETYINNENKISNGLIKDKDYSFIPSNYLIDTSKEMSNPVKLKDYVDVIRGFRKSKETSSKKENIKIIQVSNLNKNFIDIEDLDSVNYKSITSKDLLKDNDIILSRSSSNFQCRLLHIKENEKVIASENIIILRVKDTKELSPYYLEEYLNSKKGKKDIFVNQVKSTITMIQINKLNNTYIDLISKEKQKEVEKLSLNKYEEILKNKKKIESINNSISKLLEK